MKIDDEERVKTIVEEVVRGLVQDGRFAPQVEAPGDGIFPSMEAAIDAAEVAQRELTDLTLEKRGEIIEAIRQVGIEGAEEFARRTLEEAGMGNIPDKIQKHLIAARLTPGVEDLESVAWSGDHGLSVVEMAPWGVIGAITPSTHPIPTALNNAISIVAAGNSVVFNPHPSAKAVSAYGIRRINQGIVAAGGPRNLLTAVEEPTIETGQMLFTHPKIALLLITGGPGVVKAAMKSEKRVIAAGPGNPPVVVDETADLEKAARDIIQGAVFDYNILCIAEKEILVVASVADALKAQLRAHGAYELTAPQVERLTQLAFPKDERTGHPVLNRELVGRAAPVLAERIGVSVDKSIQLLIGETSFEHLFVQEEQMMPFLPIVRVPNVDRAIDLAVEAEHGYGHTAIIHSKNVETLTKMGKRCNTAIYVKNGPSGAGLGVGGEGFTSFSIAGPTGEGITSARTFTRQRRCVMVDYLRIV